MDPRAKRRGAILQYLISARSAFYKTGLQRGRFRKAKPLILPDCDAIENGETLRGCKAITNMSARSTQTFAYSDEETSVPCFI